ncbi:hypothetical protein LWI29_025095 [Acer saccharum]|uniref:Uncharacterized protein n=1 Tax=Acer saccharum TaxID=4024 RepID=A0AA39VZY8_ACESA|nr:hypothetical protein LWI29_025095 [Acer saccharum]
MGRYSRFIAMYATLAIRDVDCCLIPKSQFYLEGPGGHMVIVIAGGAGQCKHTMDQIRSDDATSKSPTDPSERHHQLTFGGWLRCGGGIDKNYEKTMPQHVSALEIRRHGLKVAVAGIPKTIDNAFQL